MKKLWMFALFFSSFFSLWAFADFKVVHYTAEVVPQVKEHKIEGWTEVQIQSNVDQLKQVSFPRNQLEVLKVQIDRHSQSLVFKLTEKEILIQLETPLRMGREEKLKIFYKTPKDPEGVHFGQSAVYSAFSTCNWMVCKEEPGERAGFELRLVLPEKTQSVASGNLFKKEEIAQHLERHVWVESIPYPTYLFGFAIGQFQKDVVPGQTRIESYGEKISLDDLKFVFQNTPKMLKFFEEKAGVKLPHSVYRQILVSGQAGQEMTSFSVVGKKDTDEMLANPKDDWLVAHELAHQWWGNLITCKTWDHFWLNEGLTVFMVAAYKEAQWGKEEYDRELALAQKRYQKAVQSGNDRPLVSPISSYPSWELKQSIVYSKGALFVAELRKVMGEKDFWEGFQDYTRSFQKKSVESKDFQTVMQKHTNKDLADLFQKWVYKG